MKKNSIIGAALACLLALGACSKVPAGNVGVKVYLLGGAKGVDTEELTPGRYWIGVNEDLYLFPTFTQNYTWEKNDKADESISFQTAEGMTVDADVGISYNIEPTKVPLVFQKYRKGVEEITDIYLRNMVRDALVTAASDKPIENVYGKGKAELMHQVEEIVRAQVSGLGIRIERIYWIGSVRLPDNVIKALNLKIQATQIAQQRENEVLTAQAQAQIEVAKAEGDSKSILLRAEADAKAIKLKSDALASSPKLVDLTIAERWDGHLPSTMLGATTPLLNLPK